MSRDFNKNKVAVLTGAAKKIGRSTAIKLAEQGFNILIHTGGKSIEEAKDTIKLLEKFKIKLPRTPKHGILSFKLIFETCSNDILPTNP